MSRHFYTSLIRTGTLAGMALFCMTGPVEADDLDHGANTCMNEWLAWSNLAGQDGRVPPQFDEATGKSLLNYPPDRLVDMAHMRLGLTIQDMNDPTAQGEQILTFEPIGNALSSLDLNAALLDIHTVMASGHSVSFSHDGYTLHVEFDPPVAVGQRVELATTYTITDPPQGLYWTPETSDWPGRPAQIHTQGEPESNRYWFPSHDFPNERMTTELIVTVPDGYLVSSNGKLVNSELSGDDLDLRTFHWMQDKPHVSYLVSLIVGKFDVVDVGTPGLSMPVYVPPGRARDVQATYGRTGQMIELFEQLFDEPYPWDRYAQLVVHNFVAGGMENTSATTMYGTALLRPSALQDHDLDGLIAHELGHQWFGDLITCNSWEHIWLNEGFATFLSNLWFEHRDGKDAYIAGIQGNFDRVIARDQTDAPYQPAMVSKQYDDPWNVFGRAANPYPKGASILHMLRMRYGDQMFFRAIQVYVDRFKLETAETNDLRKVFEEVTGDGLESFFEQWCMRPGVPRVDMDIQWDSQARELIVQAVQTQNIDQYNPAFEFTLPIWIGKRTSRDGQWARLQISGREASARFALKSEPQIVAVDPNLTVLAEFNITQDADRWIAQVQDGPTVAARIQAARALSSISHEHAGIELERLARDGRAQDAERIAAVTALADRDDAARLSSLAEFPVDDPNVRAAIITALATEVPEGDARRDRITSMVVDAAWADSSSRVRAAAIGQLGQLGADPDLELLHAALETDSQNDEVRRAALRAIGNMDSADGFAAAVLYSLPGTNNRTRPTAINTIVALAHHRPDLAFDAISTLVNDREFRTWRAAGGALVELGDERGIAVLESMLEAKRDTGDQRQIQGWIDALRAKSGNASQ